MKRVERWDRFANEYVKQFDRIKAYKVAGYRCKTDRIADNAATRLLCTNVYVQKKVQELLKKQEIKAEKNAEDVVKELIKVGFSDIENYIEIDSLGNIIIKPIKSLGNEKSAAIESIQQTVVITSNKKGEREYETKKTKFKLHDKLEALKELGKHFGIYGKDYQAQSEALISLLGIIDGSSKGVLPRDEDQG